MKLLKWSWIVFKAIFACTRSIFIIYKCWWRRCRGGHYVTHCNLRFISLQTYKTKPQPKTLTIDGSFEILQKDQEHDDKEMYSKVVRCVCVLQSLSLLCLCHVLSPHRGPFIVDGTGRNMQAHTWLITQTVSWLVWMVDICLTDCIYNHRQLLVKNDEYHWNLCVCNFYQSDIQSNYLSVWMCRIMVLSLST